MPTTISSHKNTEVFPESVQDDGEGLLQMDDHNVTPYLVAALQQLNQQLIAKLEQSRAIGDLRHELDSLWQSEKLAAAS